MAYRQKDGQLSFDSFGSALGTPHSPERKQMEMLVNQIPWRKLEDAHQLAFSSQLGRAGKPFRQQYGAKLLKPRTGFSDRELVGAIRDTPAFQYFMGLPVYQAKAPFTFSSLSYFRRCIASISELLRNLMAGFVHQDLHTELDLQGLTKRNVMIIDAPAIPVKIKYPQDTKRLNQARLSLEADLKTVSKRLKIIPPRIYKREAHKVWTAFSCKPRR